MATIGTFTKSGDGFSGSVKTLTLNVKAQMRPADKESEKAPDYRVFAGPTEFGAAWQKTSREGRVYLSVKLEFPGTDLRLAGRGRGRLQPDLVAHPQRRLSRGHPVAPRPDLRAGRSPGLQDLFLKQPASLKTSTLFHRCFLFVREAHSDTIAAKGNLTGGDTGNRTIMMASIPDTFARIANP